MSEHFRPEPKGPSARRSPQQNRPEPPGNPDEDWVVIGRIVGLFGVQGDLKVMPQTDIPNRFAQLSEVFLGPNHQRHHITNFRPYKGEMALIRLKGIASATSAEELIGLPLSVPLAAIAPLPPNQYYIHDLIGLRVETSGAQILGVIKDILPTGGNDVYVIREQGSGREVLAPAVKEMVKRIDIAAGVIILDPIPGLFDERFEEAR